MTVLGIVSAISARSIIPGNNDRTQFERASLYELADSIRENGLAQPITVRPFGLGLWQIVAGERRYKAMTEILGWDEIPCLVRELSDEDASAIMLAENVGRKDLDPVDEAFAYQSRVDKYGWAASEISRRCGVNTDRVTSRLKLCKVREDILFHVRRAAFPVGHAVMLSVLDRNRQMMAAQPIIEGAAIGARAFRSLVDKLFYEQQQEVLFAAPIFGGPLEKPVVQAIKIALGDIPDENTLPDLTLSNVENHTGALMFDYIQTLIKAGFHHEARVVGKVLRFLVKTNAVRLPVKADLPAVAPGSAIPERVLMFRVDLDA